MKRALQILGALLALLLALFFGVAYFSAQRADYAWRPRIAQPSFTVESPRLLFDEGHFNASTAGFTGRYWPFARLLRADGYAFERRSEAFTSATFEGVRILVVANASGAPKPQLFGLNLPVRTVGRRGDPAFRQAEIDAVRSWIVDGGSLLLIADHAPFGEAAADLAAALGVTMHRGFVEVPGEPSDPLLFSDDNGRLGDHPILRGWAPGEGVRRVMTYTGQSLDGPVGAVVLLRLPETAVEAVPVGDALEERPAGQAQGLAFALGRGRVVVLGEAAMVTAQVSRRVPYGINAGDNDNQQFVRNTLRWLAHER